MAPRDDGEPIRVAAAETGEKVQFSILSRIITRRCRQYLTTCLITMITSSTGVCRGILSTW